jgi:hypothetical protein
MGKQRNVFFILKKEAYVKQTVIFKQHIIIRNNKVGRIIYEKKMEQFNKQHFFQK